jgi:hypothetical protein
VDIAWLRDLIIVIYGILGILLAVPLFIFIIIFYRKIKQILETVENTTTEAKEVIGTLKNEFVSPLSKIMIVFQTIKQTATLVSEFINKQKEEPHE